MKKAIALLFFIISIFAFSMNANAATKSKNDYISISEGAFSVICVIAVIGIVFVIFIINSCNSDNHRLYISNEKLSKKANEYDSQLKKIQRAFNLPTRYYKDHDEQITDIISGINKLLEKANQDKNIQESINYKLYRQLNELECKSNNDNEAKKSFELQKELNLLNSQLSIKDKYINHLKNYYGELINKLQISNDNLYYMQNPEYDTLFLDDAVRKMYIERISDIRFTKAYFENLKLKQPYHVACKSISATSGESYTTTLEYCTCTDYTYQKKPCKHMIALALSVGAFKLSEDELKSQLYKVSTQWKEVHQLNEKTKEYLSEIKEIKSFINDKKINYPYLADFISRFNEAKRNVTVRDNVTKKELTAMIKKAEKENNLLRNQLSVYEYMFPMLQELNEVRPEQLIMMTDMIEGNKMSYQWLSPEEYSALTNTEKQNMFLKNYFAKRSKNAWEAGIKYERYIGYLCEKEGYRIQYTGATLRLNDMGRDLIVSKGNRVYIIQCKRHAKDKEIHENHLFQLFGSIHEYAKNNEKKKVTGVFVTTTKLSDVAMECARCLNIEVFENVDFKEYPLIKCNIAKNKERIYHLPYDQQYDNVKMSLDGEEFYAATVEDAERAGFRHAHKYLGS